MDKVAKSKLLPDLAHEEMTVNHSRNHLLSYFKKPPSRNLSLSTTTPRSGKLGGQ